MSAPRYEERECPYCFEGRVYVPEPHPKPGRWETCPKCRGARTLRVYLYPRPRRCTR
jgi:hypothetical protein